MAAQKLLYILLRTSHGGTQAAPADNQEYGGGIQDSKSVQAYLNGPVKASIKANPDVPHWPTRMLDVDPFLTEITAGLSQL